MYLNARNKEKVDNWLALLYTSQRSELITTEEFHYIVQCRSSVVARANTKRSFEEELLAALGGTLLDTTSIDSLKGITEEKQLNAIAERIVAHFGEDDVENFLGEINYSDEALFKQYGKDPVGFCTKELNYTMTDDMERLMCSVLDNPVTIAISGTGVGKTMCSAMISSWFFRCLPRSQVYVTAAPPAERNLKAKLWSELQD